MGHWTSRRLVDEIRQLGFNSWYEYPSNPDRKFILTEIVGPEGPIKFTRSYIERGQRKHGNGSVSSAKIARIAPKLIENNPIHVDELFQGGGNERSALEAMLANTPQFYVCFPMRVISTSTGTKSINDQKHIIWVPGSGHPLGQVGRIESDLIINQLRNDIEFKLTLPPILNDDIKLRRHAQIQIELIEIGEQLGFRSWIASNDHSIQYKGRRIIEHSSVVKDLSTEKMIAGFEGGQRAAGLVDCIWFRNGNAMPAVMEVEHSTGVTSGLTRMKKLKDILPPYGEDKVRWTIVAPDELRTKIVNEASQSIFEDLKIKFFPYSAVDELHSFARRRPIKGVNDEFLDSFMEEVSPS